ncbi:MAG: hypothetical protein KME08_03350 [Aphanothece sp. CMT-3BRIN-NPC111]|jgi:hypothetical protein|nr:hypothetical protein [Aphanothece sp. CMT-3BRIN-NPC111]
MTTQSQVIQVSPEFSDEQLLAICEAAEVLACKCPAYLVKLLQEVKEFRRYTHECMEKFPEDTATHEWLEQKSSEMELLLSKTIFEFLQKENFLDEENQLCLNQLYERTHAIAIGKIRA